MIQSYGTRETRNIFHYRFVSSLPPEILRRAARKLHFLNATCRLADLAAVPGNHLERLSGNLRNFFSIRINKQWRIIFQWHNGDAYKVTIIDYHS